MPGENSISENRVKIDEIDKKIIELLNQRADLSLTIRDIKKASGVEIYDPAREEEIIDALCKKNNGPLNDENVRDLFKNILEIMRGIPDKK